MKVISLAYKADRYNIAYNNLIKWLCQTLNTLWNFHFHIFTITLIYHINMKNYFSFMQKNYISLDTAKNWINDKIYKKVTIIRHLLVKVFKSAVCHKKCLCIWQFQLYSFNNVRTLLKIKVPCFTRHGFLSVL